MVLTANHERMTPERENKLRMYNSCDTFLLSRHDILKVLPNFEPTYRTFQHQFAGIQKYAAQESFEVVRHATTKKKRKNDLAFMTRDISRKLHAFAHSANDYALLNETWLTENELLAHSDLKLIDRARRIYELAAIYLRELTLYGITATTQAAFSQAIAHFEASLHHSKGVEDAKMAAGELDDLFINADLALEQIDGMIEIFRVSSPDFYNSYHQSRKILEYGPQLAAVEGKVTDADTNDPVQGVTILFVSCDNSFRQPPFLKISADHGDFYVQSLAEGTYEIKMNKIGYREVILTSKVNKGEHCQIHTKMYRV